MGIQRAGTLYPVNSTTIDTGTGIDVRLLDSAQAGATDTSQSCTANHTQDNVNRCFNPANAAVGTAGNPGTLQKLGYALRLSQDMTPSDNTNCNAVLLAGTATLSISVSVNQSGGTYITGSYGPRWAWGLFKYDPATDTGTTITFGFVDPGTTWDYTPVTGDLGTFKTITQSMDIPSQVEFTDSEILLLQIGFNTLTIPNPTLGTATWTFTLAVDDPNTKIDWASGQGIRQACTISDSALGNGDVPAANASLSFTRSAVGDNAITYARAAFVSKAFDLLGDGVATEARSVQAQRSFSVIGDGIVNENHAVIAAKTFLVLGDGQGTINALLATMARSAVGDGESSYTKATIVSKVFDAAGEGSASRAGLIAALLPRDAVGEGIANEFRSVIASKSFDVVGDGVITRIMATEVMRSVEGCAEPSFSKNVNASKTFDVIGDGPVSEVHPVQAFRSFTLISDGRATGTITIPIDEVPTGEGGEIVIKKSPIYLFVDD